MIGDDDDFEIPAFLRGGNAESIVDNLEQEEDAFDFPTLDDDDEDDLGLPDEEEAPAEQPAPEPAKPRKETKADKQAKLKAQPAPQPEEPKAEPENKRARPGDNSGVDGAALKSFIERIERLEEEKKTIGDDIKEVKAEAKGSGYDGKTLAAVLKLRKKDKAERDEEEALLHLYMFALGME